MYQQTNNNFNTENKKSDLISGLKPGIRFEPDTWEKCRMHRGEGLFLIKPANGIAGSGYLQGCEMMKALETFLRECKIKKRDAIRHPFLTNCFFVKRRF